MKKLTILRPIFIVLFFLLSPLAFAQNYESSDDSWVYRSSYLILDANMRVDIELEEIAGDNYVESLNALVDFYPRETPEQRLLETDFRPKPKDTDDGLLFEWKKPEDDDVSLIMNSRIRVENDPPRITKKVSFPLANLPQNVRVFTQPAEIIDVNDDIIALASSLAEGEDDLAVVVDKLAAWVTRNVQYNLTTVTAEAAQKASWVLRHKEGVCDELTSLFIAMLRSLNIPARFVAGISYTNSPQFEQKWGPHGWAEVYYPGIGWVPYDVTYGEYGYVDPTHIVARYAQDAGKISTKFTWRARSTEVNIQPLETTVRINEYGRELFPPIEITAEPLKGSVGFGSYNLIEATVHNLANYYLPLDVYISRTSKMTVLDSNKQHILLKPNEAKKVFWVVNVDEDLRRNYLYTFPVLVYTLGNISSLINFAAIDDGALLSREKVLDEMRERQRDTVISIEHGLDIQCEMDKESYYLDETPDVRCAFINTGNSLLQNVKLCFGTVCQTEDIGITQRKEIPSTHRIESDVPNDIVVTADNHNVHERRIVNIQTKDYPALEITSLRYPANVSYEDLFDVVFMVQKTSRTSPTRVRTTLSLGATDVQFSLDNLPGEQVYDVSLAGKDLLGTENTFVIRAQWEDDLGRSYETTRSFTIVLNELTASQKMRIWLQGFGDWVADLFS